MSILKSSANVNSKDLKKPTLEQTTNLVNWRLHLQKLQTRPFNEERQKKDTYLHTMTMTMLEYDLFLLSYCIVDERSLHPV